MVLELAHQLLQQALKSIHVLSSKPSPQMSFSLPKIFILFQILSRETLLGMNLPPPISADVTS